MFALKFKLLWPHISKIKKFYANGKVVEVLVSGFKTHQT